MLALALALLPPPLLVLLLPRLTWHGRRWPACFCGGRRLREQMAELSADAPAAVPTCPSPADTIRTIESYADVVVLRHFQVGQGLPSLSDQGFLLVWAWSARWRVLGACARTALGRCPPEHSALPLPPARARGPAGRQRGEGGRGGVHPRHQRGRRPRPAPHAGGLRETGAARAGGQAVGCVGRAAGARLSWRLAALPSATRAACTLDRHLPFKPVLTAHPAGAAAPAHGPAAAPSAQSLPRPRPPTNRPPAPQALLDVYTIQREIGRLDKFKIGLVRAGWLGLRCAVRLAVGRRGARAAAAGAPAPGPGRRRRRRCSCAAGASAPAGGASTRPRPCPLHRLPAARWATWPAGARWHLPPALLPDPLPPPPLPSPGRCPARWATWPTGAPCAPWPTCCQCTLA